MPYNRLTDGAVLSAAQQNQNLTDLETLSKTAQGYCVLSGLTLSAGTGLSANVAAGKAAIKKLVEVAASTVNGLPPSATTYLWLRDDGAFTQTSSLTPPSGAHALLGSVTTGATSVTGVDNAIAWKGQRVEGDTQQVTGPNALAVALNATRVGVGTNAPSDELHVSGTARADAIALPERGSAPSAVANRGFLYTKDSAGATELYFRSDSGAEVQLTAAGSIPAGGYLPLSGGTMSGDVAMNAHKVSGLAAASANGDAVRYEQAVKAGDAVGGDLSGTMPNPYVASGAITAAKCAAALTDLLIDRFYTWWNSVLTLVQGNTTYVLLNSGVGAANSGSESNVQFKLYDKSFAFKNLRVVVTANGCTSASTVTLRDDGSDTTLQVTIPASTTGTFEDTSHAPSVAAGSLVNYSVAAGSGGTSLSIRSIQCEAVAS